MTVRYPTKTYAGVQQSLGRIRISRSALAAALLIGALPLLLGLDCGAGQPIPTDSGDERTLEGSLRDAGFTVLVETEPTEPIATRILMTEDQTRAAIIVSEGDSSVVFGLDDSDPDLVFQLLTPDGTVFASAFEGKVVLADGSEFSIDDLTDSPDPPPTGEQASDTCLGVGAGGGPCDALGQMVFESTLESTPDAGLQTRVEWQNTGNSTVVLLWFDDSSQSCQADAVGAFTACARGIEARISETPSPFAAPRWLHLNDGRRQAVVSLECFPGLVGQPDERDAALEQVFQMIESGEIRLVEYPDSNCTSPSSVHIEDLKLPSSAGSKSSTRLRSISCNTAEVGSALLSIAQDFGVSALSVGCAGLGAAASAGPQALVTQAITLACGLSAIDGAVRGTLKVYSKYVDCFCDIIPTAEPRQVCFETGNQPLPTIRVVATLQVAGGASCRSLVLDRIGRQPEWSRSIEGGPGTLQPFNEIVGDGEMAQFVETGKGSIDRSAGTATFSDSLISSGRGQWTIEYKFTPAFGAGRLGSGRSYTVTVPVSSITCEAPATFNASSCGCDCPPGQRVVALDASLSLFGCRDDTDDTGEAGGSGDQADGMDACQRRVCQTDPSCCDNFDFACEELKKQLCPEPPPPGGGGPPPPPSGGGDCDCPVEGGCTSILETIADLERRIAAGEPGAAALRTALVQFQEASRICCCE